MALLQSKLADELAKMEPVDNEPAAINSLANAWEIYFSAAMAGVIPVNPGSLGPAIALFKTTLAGMSVPGAAIVKLPAALGAFWGIVSGTAGGIFTGTTGATPPPGLAAGLVPGLLDAFQKNLDGNADLKAAANSIAKVLHENAGLGGTAVTTPGPVVNIV